MSKASQRRQSAYSLGCSDGKRGFYRWSKHPLLSIYHAGFKNGRRLACLQLRR